jgi:hypothetical protein
MNKYFIFLILLVGCSTHKKHNLEKLTSETYNGGRFGYVYTTLFIYSDSTYQYSEFVHSGRSIDDFGKIENLNGKTYLNSIKTKTEFRKGKSSKKLHFKKQKIKINGDTLFIIPEKDKSPETLKLFYTLIRETEEDKYNYSKKNVIGQSLMKELKQNKEFKKYNKQFNDVNISIINKSKMLASDFDFGIPTTYLEIPIVQSDIPNFLEKYKFKITKEIRKTTEDKVNYQYFYISLIRIKENTATIKLQYYWNENKNTLERKTETEYKFKRKNGGWKLVKTVANKV